MKLIENGTGSVYEYLEDRGLISKDGSIVSGEEYEPVFSKTAEGRPVFCGIFLKREGKFISLSGNKSEVSW